MASDGRGGRGSRNGAATIVKRVATAVVIAAVLWFAVQGGEYSTWDLLVQRREKARLLHEKDSLTTLVDSLKRYEAKVEHDPATQERIAREVFGMVRGDKEIKYTFADTGR